MTSQLSHKTKITPIERLISMYKTLIQFQTTSKTLKLKSELENQTTSIKFKLNSEIEHQSIILSNLTERKTFVANRTNLELAVLTASRKSTDLKLNALKIVTEIKSRLELIEKVQNNSRNFIQLTKRATLTLNLLE